MNTRIKPIHKNGTGNTLTDSERQNAITYLNLIALPVSQARTVVIIIDKLEGRQELTDHEMQIVASLLDQVTQSLLPIIHKLEARLREKADGD